MKEKIKNRDGKNISVIVQEQKNQKGLVFIVHGLGGYKEQKFLEESAMCLFNLGYTVVRYDSTNTFGESDGKYEHATATGYLHDLEDVIKWSKDKSWYENPILVGHSLGGLITSIYTNRNSVAGLVLLNPAISKKKQKGKVGEVKNPHTGETHFLESDFVSDYLQYNLLEEINKLTIPFKVIVSDKDYNRTKERFDQIKTELKIIPDTGHNFREKEKEVGEAVCSWVKKNMIQ